MGTVRGEGCERYMGISILELVLQRLREGNFRADVAYPGQKYPRVKETVAAVHIEKVDRANLTVTVEVNIVSPAELGGTACELEALRATELLRWSGGVCVQNGCSYDGVAQVYVVPVLATFTCATEAEDCTMGPGFSVYIDDVFQSNAVSVSGEAVRQLQAVYAMGETEPVGASRGTGLWNITLEELVPGGYAENEPSEEVFVLKIVTDVTTEIYRECRWTSVKREHSREGLRQIRKGIALSREVE